MNPSPVCGSISEADYRHHHQYLKKMDLNLSNFSEIIIDNQATLSNFVSTNRVPKMTSEVDTDALFDGVIEPSDQAYVDFFMEKAEIAMEDVSVRSYEEQLYSKPLKTHVTRYNHDVFYKGDLIWRIEIDSHYEGDEKRRFSTSCKLSDGNLAIYLKTKGKQDRKTRSDRKSKIEKRLLDIASLIRASAAAYQLRAAEEEIGIQYEILNSGSQAEESVNNLYSAESFSSYISQSFSSYISMTKTGSDDYEGTEGDQEATEDDRNELEEDYVVRDDNNERDDERSAHSGHTSAEGMSQASSHASSESSVASQRSAKKSKAKIRKREDSWGIFDLISFLG